MGQYRLQVKFQRQFGFLISWDKGFSLSIDVPFVVIYIGLTEDAQGVDIFGRYF